MAETLTAKQLVTKIYTGYQVRVSSLMPVSILTVLVFKGLMYLQQIMAPTLVIGSDLLTLKSAIAFILENTVLTLVWSFFLLSTHHKMVDPTSSYLAPFRQYVSSIFPLVLANILFSISLCLGAILVFFWVYFIVIFWFFPLKICLEGAGARQGLGYSYALVSKRWWYCFHKLTLCIFSPVVIYFVLRVFIPAVIYPVLDLIFCVLFLPWASTATLYLYRYFSQTVEIGQDLPESDEGGASNE